MKRLKTIFRRRGFLIAISVAAAMALVSAPSVWAQDYEWEPGEGLHQEEWYDPSDWFDNDAGIDYENDWYDYTYNYPNTYYYDQGLYGYYGDGEPYDDGYTDWDDPYDYDYYSEDWYDEDVDNDWW